MSLSIAQNYLFSKHDTDAKKFAGVQASFSRQHEKKKSSHQKEQRRICYFKLQEGTSSRLVVLKFKNTQQYIIQLPNNNNNKIVDPSILF